MSCSPTTIKDSLLGELSAADERALQQHLQQCGTCREEWERLQMTHAAMLCVRDEDPPRRIAFVSDKVFEPKWWERLWQSGPKLGFASAAMLSAAILAHTFVRPAPVVVAPNTAQVTVDTSMVRAAVDRAVNERVQAAVTKAVADAENRIRTEDARVVAAGMHDLEKRIDLKHRADMLAVEQTFEVVQKRLSVQQIASNQIVGGQ